MCNIDILLHHQPYTHEADYIIEIKIHKYNSLQYNYKLLDIHLRLFQH